MANLFEKLIADLERRRVKRRLKAAFARNPRPAKPRDVTPPEAAMLRGAARRSTKLIAKGGQHGTDN